ncbi:MAG: hypothetical protein JXR83_06315 [Deltaproteobacteria bacterium]|nr:hypothetical protein [Deltaproteobacteria bacterium]
MRALRSALVLVCALAACQRAASPELTLRPPPRIMAALPQLTDLQATAYLAPKDRAPLAGVALERGSDGESFAGFVAAEPGSYRLDVVFSGVFQGARLFIGRWRSDAFTIAAGDVVTPTFSQPLDTIGDPADRGDDDGDGLGNVDEILYGTHLDSGDSDGDGVADGADCDPADPASSYAIAESGSIEDCDGDGYLRPGLPLPTSSGAQIDCNDRDPTVNPAQQNCPADDQPPAISVLEPTPGQTLGCQRRIRARIEDASGIAGAHAEVTDLSGARARLTMRLASGSEYRTDLFYEVNGWIRPGAQTISVCATDSVGNTGCSDVAMNFAFRMPSASVLPQSVGNQSNPFDLTVAAAVAGGSIAAIALKRFDWQSGDDDVERSREIAVGDVAASSAVFHIDPGSLAQGIYLFYPVVTDDVGNQLGPDDTFAVDVAGDELVTAQEFAVCEFYDVDPLVPVRRLVVGPTAPTLMRAHLDEAIALAAGRDAGAALVEILGWGIQPDGGIALYQLSPEGDGKLWRYTFFNFTDDRQIEITWHSAADATGNPEVAVTEDSPWGYTFHPFAAAPATLVDSDAAAAAYAASAGCPAITGHESDRILYESNQPFTADDVVHIEASGSAFYWQATAVAPIDVLEGCQ